MSTITWNDLFTSGSLIHFSRHQWHARMELTPTDLGIVEMSPDGVVVPQKRGKKVVNTTLQLCDPEAFKGINKLMGEFASTIENSSMNFPVLDAVRYVPDAKASELETSLQDIRRRFQVEVEKFVANFDSIKQTGMERVRSELPKFCRNDDALAVCLARVESEYPDATKVRAKFDQEYAFFTISLPVSEEAAKAARDVGPQIRSVMSSMVGQLREELNTKVATLIRFSMEAASSVEGKSLNMKSVNSALETLNRVESMNIMKDALLADQIRDLRQLLETVRDNKDNKVDTNLSDLIGGLTKSQQLLSSDASSAVAEAEQRLTGCSRKLTM